ncbi:hypothetical protein JG687_00001325 [Phytophthora cactorum]|uniref:Uncharacterized protein n=1 Tax=Phytophthora cactorum TaxID=29920 RepID=A0A8T1UXM7_9STRA|nr:hypothetical protein JG687_00001325 [Phytophthora cactorum]
MERFIHWSRELESLYLHKTIRDAVSNSDALKITMRAIPPERSTKREVKVLLSDCRTPGDENASAKRERRDQFKTSLLY